MATMRGLERHHEQDPRQLLRDTRTLEQRIVDFFSNTISAISLFVGLSIASVLFSAITDFIFFIGIGCFIYAYTRRVVLPFRIPKRSQLLDYNDLVPGGARPRQAQGICLFGNEISSGEELWFSNEDMRTHCLIFGSTGSGKTEALVSIAFNALVQGSGFIYVDGKGDNSLFAKIFSMARQMGREDDVLLVNFMTGARDIIGPQDKRLSNTMNPFANGSSSMLSQLVISLMEESSGSSDGDMWKGRAIAFVEALMRILVYMRDQEAILLDANVIRNYFELNRIENIVVDRLFPRDNQEPVNLANVPELVLEPITNYLINLPGYDRVRKGRQSPQVLEQHGFVTMQLTRVFGSLADTYGHILRTNLAEVDMRDVVLNRRILVVLLPAFEKSLNELSNLGKIIVASLKAMLAAGLGEEVEGEYRDIIQRKPTNSPAPYLCILDEYGYYAVEGFAVVPAQARSLGFSIIFAGQDLPAFQKASKEEAASIGANCNIKICMKLEDPLETWDFFSKTTGESWVTKVDAFQTRSESVLNHYADTRSASSEKRPRIDLLDLKEQREGEAHILFKSKIIRARMFYADPRPVPQMRLNQFLKVAIPPSRVIDDLHIRLEKFHEVIHRPALIEDQLNEISQIEPLKPVFQDKTRWPIELGVEALNTVHALNIKMAAESEENALTLESFDEEAFSIFRPLQLEEQLSDIIQVSNTRAFAQALLSKEHTREYIASIEKIAGNFSKQSLKIANEIIKDMEKATHYPPEQEESLSISALVPLVSKLIRNIRKAQMEQNE
jgi:intracellular multiplication protein IcmO